MVVLTPGSEKRRANSLNKATEISHLNMRETLMGGQRKHRVLAGPQEGRPVTGFHSGAQAGGFDCRSKAGGVTGSVFWQGCLSLVDCVIVGCKPGDAQEAMGNGTILPSVHVFPVPDPGPWLCMQGMSLNSRLTGRSRRPGGGAHVSDWRTDVT